MGPFHAYRARAANGRILVAGHESKMLHACREDPLVILRRGAKRVRPSSPPRRHGREPHCECKPQGSNDKSERRAGDAKDREWDEEDDGRKRSNMPAFDMNGAQRDNSSKTDSPSQQKRG